MKLWSEQLISNELVDYHGDPLLDFGVANFLDRISYKAPKSAEKIAKFRKRMAAYEKPLNEINFQEGEQPEVARADEEYMYKFLTKRAVGQVAKGDKKGEEEDAGFDSEDPELEQFANDEIEKEMKRLNGN